MVRVLFKNLKIKTVSIFLCQGILMLFCFATQAQTSFPNSNEIRTNNAKKTDIHFFSGLSISYLRGNVAVDNNIMNQRKSKYGYAVGLTFNRELHRKFSLTTGLIFEKKGSISNTTATYFDETDQSLKQGIIEYEYDYFTLPVQIFYSIGSRKMLSVGVGPFVSYLKKQTLARNFLFVYSTPGRELTDETDMNTKLDFGIVTNILFKIPLNSRSLLSLQLSNTLGLLNIRPNLYQEQVMKTNNTSLLIGFITKRKNYD